MEFEFIKNDFLGEYHAKFSLEHQVIGRWLVEEIGHHRTKIEQVYLLLEQAYIQPTKEHILVGSEMSLMVLQGEVTIEENTLSQCIESELEPDFSIYVSESQAICGLDDFASMFDQWCEFTHQL
jgi:uncharacterized protein YacL (UPF0231 family)